MKRKSTWTDQGLNRTCRCAVACLLVMLMLVGCVSDREFAAVPKEHVNSVVLQAIPTGEQPRVWGDAMPTASRSWLVEARVADVHTYPGYSDSYLAISGGGADGAFGAGLLCGWTEAGTRPQFKLVTGVSTGALAAPFALLGSEYDDTLREIYTAYQTEDLVSDLGMRALFVGDAAANSEPLREKIRYYISDEIVEALAEAHREGRTLLVGTTNLDADRPVIWNLTVIAASDYPGKTRLIRNVLLASASVPGAFPPVFFNVIADGEVYQEMHVDGGAKAQVFLGPAWTNWEPSEQDPSPPNLYIIRNGKLTSEYEPVDVSLFSIAQRAMSSLIKSNGINDVNRLYVQSKTHGLQYHLAFIPNTFEAKWDQMFDPVYMQKLFNVGYNLGLSGEAWHDRPPGEDHADEPTKISSSSL